MRVIDASAPDLRIGDCLGHDLYDFAGLYSELMALTMPIAEFRLMSYRFDFLTHRLCGKWRHASAA